MAAPVASADATAALEDALPAREVGETLTADTFGIADEDGLTNAVFSHRWVRSGGNGGTNVQDATDSSYTLTEGGEGKTINVQVNFTDDGDNQETLTSAATGKAVWGAPPKELLFYSEAVRDEGIELSWSSDSDSTETEYVLCRRVLRHEKGSARLRPSRMGRRVEE